MRSQIIQPIVAGGQDQAAAFQRGLMDFDLQRVQKCLLAHRLDDTAGTQHGQPALDPDMRVEGALGRSRAALDGDSDREAAAIAHGVSLPQQRLGDHLARHMVDGCRTHRLIQPGLCHAAHTCAAVDGDSARRIRQQRDRGNDRQAGGGVDIVAAVLDDGAFCAVRRGAAELRRDLDHNTLGGTQADRFRHMAGQQQPRRPRRPQRRTGAGGVAAAQQLLPAADIVFKLWLCIAIFK